MWNRHDLLPDTLYFCPQAILPRYITLQGKKMQLTLKGRTAIELIRRAGLDIRLIDNRNKFLSLAWDKNLFR
ncbi:hypothetical protein MHH93_01855 [Priestia sp. FSL H7-0729]